MIKKTAIALLIITVLTIMYASYLHLSSHYGDISIGGINVKGMTPEMLSKECAKYNTVTFIIGKKKEKIELPISYIGQDRKDVFLTHFGIKTFPERLDNGTEEALKKKLKKYNGKPVNAKIDTKNLKIISGKNGISLDFSDISDKVFDAKYEDIRLQEYTVNTKDYEKAPKITRKTLGKDLKYLKTHIKGGITVVYGNVATSIGQEDLAGCVKKRKVIKSRVSRLLPGSVTPSEITVRTSAGKKTLPNYSLSMKVDKEKTAEKIIDGINNRKKKVYGICYTPGDEKKVEVNLGAQQVICGGFSSPCVTGTAGHRTPVGVYRISYKTTNVTLKGRNDDGSEYASPVSYWMPFNGGIGLHDASWRSSFGGSIYVSNGSHGCVNMPAGKARELFSKVSAGTLVVVY